MRRIRRNTQGFTIVELLIVIVVIAILAAITIVAYNGIQTRAENNKTISAVTQYLKALKLHYAEVGSYPLDDPAVYKYKCLGDVGETCGMISGTYTASCQGVGAVTNTSDADLTALNNAIKARINAIPQASQQEMTCDNRQVKGAIYFAYYGSIIVRYYLKGDQGCSGSGASKLFIAPETTVCAVILPE